MPPYPRLISLKIHGYRPFREFEASLKPLEVIVGANGSGKSSLFEFLRFLRDSIYSEIPAEIIPGSIGQQIFHIPGPEKFQWDIEIDMGQLVPLRYQGELIGPVGRTQITSERVESSRPLHDMYDRPYLFMNIQGNRGVIQQPGEGLVRTEIKQDVASKRNQLALSAMTNPEIATLFKLGEYIRSWRFYSSFNIANDKIRKSVLIEQEPGLREDASNLSSVLHYFLTEHRSIFDELQQHLRSVIPGFGSLTVKSRGEPGEVIAFWQERGVDRELSLADLSDGILRLICWMCLCLHPSPPALICIDEPDQGVHPRTLPVLAGLFEKAAEHTQLLLATHASYFLTQFELSKIAVFRKEQGEAKFFKPVNSTILTAMLEDFGSEELEQLHRSDELELLS